MSRLDPFFDPRGVIVAGASAHPGKFGFVVLHNILRCGYRGRVFATNLDGGEVLGLPVATSVDDLPDGAVDLVFVCTPGARTWSCSAPARARACGRVRHHRGLRRGGRRGPRRADEARRARRRARHPARRSQRPGHRVDAVVAVRADRGPVPAARPDRHREPVGQLRVELPEPRDPERSRREPGGVGGQRGVGRGGRLPRLPPRRPGHRGQPRLRGVGARRARLLRRGASRHRARSRSSCCRAAPPWAVATRRRRTPARWPATTASSPACAARPGSRRQPRSRRRSKRRRRSRRSRSRRAPRSPCVTTVGGWGVATADAIGRSELSLAPLPDDLRAAIDAMLPPRWSRNNPIDLAGRGDA